MDWTSVDELQVWPAWRAGRSRAGNGCVLLLRLFVATTGGYGCALRALWLSTAWYAWCVQLLLRLLLSVEWDAAVMPRRLSMSWNRDGSWASRQSCTRQGRHTRSSAFRPKAARRAGCCHACGQSSQAKLADTPKSSRGSSKL